MNTPVSFTLAKSLKERGFDEITDFFYSPNITTKSIFENINSLKNSDGNNSFYSAPTIAEVVMWLYKKYEIWLTVEQNHYHPEIFQFKITTLTNISSSPTASMVLGAATPTNYYKSPIKAYYGGVKYALKNLIP